MNGNVRIERLFPGRNRKADTGNIRKTVVIVRIAKRIQLTVFIHCHAVDNTRYLIDIRQRVDVDRKRRVCTGNRTGGNVNGKIRFCGIIFGILSGNGHSNNVNVQFRGRRSCYVNFIAEISAGSGTPDVHSVIFQTVVVRAENNSGFVTAVRNLYSHVQTEIICSGGVKIHFIRANPLRTIPHDVTGICLSGHQRRFKICVLRGKFITVPVRHGQIPVVTGMGQQFIPGVCNVL